MGYWLNVELTEAQHAALHGAADDLGIDATDLARRALRSYIRTNAKQRVFAVEKPPKVRKGRKPRPAFINCDERYGDRVPRTLADYRKLETDSEATFEVHRSEIWRVSQDANGRQHVDIVAKREVQK